MAGYVCLECNRKTKLPDFCCGHSMAASGSYVCPECKSQADNAGQCECGATLLEI